MRRMSPSNLAKSLLCVAAIAAVAATTQAFPEVAPSAVTAIQLRRADFGDFTAAIQARRIADRVVLTGETRGMPFLIIDKVAATVSAFDGMGRILGAAPVLLGIARGDSFQPGSAGKNMYHMRIDERITPAGRFMAERGIDDKGKDVLWIDYDAGIALHAVLDNPGERRRERLASPSPRDNRISYGCVNVPAEFYDDVVRPLFERTSGIVYVLPEMESARPFLTDLRLRGTPPGIAESCESSVQGCRR
jgi:hypothetical protein